MNVKSLGESVMIHLSREMQISTVPLTARSHPRRKKIDCFIFIISLIQYFNERQKKKKMKIEKRRICD